jgi:hypothetical protein
MPSHGPQLFRLARILHPQLYHDMFDRWHHEARLAPGLRTPMDSPGRRLGMLGALGEARGHVLRSTPLSHKRRLLNDPTCRGASLDQILISKSLRGWWLVWLERKHGNSRTCENNIGSGNSLNSFLLLAHLGFQTLLWLNRRPSLLVGASQWGSMV